MLRKLFQRLRGPAHAPRHATSELPSVDPDVAAHAIHRIDGLSHVDWGMADAWIARRTNDDAEPERLRRAFAGAWLDTLRDDLGGEFRRWRHAEVEGLAPLADNLAPRIAKAADHAIGVIHAALRPIRGDTPIPPLAVVALADTEQYYTFIAPYHPDEGEFATSGGCFIHDFGSFPFLAFPCNARHALENIIAHELTHHALAPLSLPLWLEEGYTQMMEERATGITNFAFTRELLERHRSRWGESGLEPFWSGDSFHSPEDDEQKLAYNLSQAIVRGMLTHRARDFFAFTRASGTDGPEAACRTHLGCSLSDLAERILGPLDADEPWEDDG